MKYAPRWGADAEWRTPPETKGRLTDKDFARKMFYTKDGNGDLVRAYFSLIHMKRSRRWPGWYRLENYMMGTSLKAPKFENVEAALVWLKLQGYVIK